MRTATAVLVLACVVALALSALHVQASTADVSTASLSRVDALKVHVHKHHRSRVGGKPTQDAAKLLQTLYADLNDHLTKMSTMRSTGSDMEKMLQARYEAHANSWKLAVSSITVGLVCKKAKKTDKELLKRPKAIKELDDVNHMTYTLRKTVAHFTAQLTLRQLQDGFLEDWIKAVDVLEDAVEQATAFVPLDRPKLLEYLQKDDEVTKYDATIAKIAAEDLAARSAVTKLLADAFAASKAALEEQQIIASKKAAEYMVERTQLAETNRAEKMYEDAKDLIHAAARGVLGTWGNTQKIKRFIGGDTPPFSVIDPAAPEAIKAFYAAVNQVDTNMPAFTKTKAFAHPLDAIRQNLVAQQRALRRYALSLQCSEEDQCNILAMVVGEPEEDESDTKKKRSGAPLVEGIRFLERIVFALNMYGK